jgi:hypothetical protein
MELDVLCDSFISGLCLVGTRFFLIGSRHTNAFYNSTPNISHTSSSGKTAKFKSDIELIRFASSIFWKIIDLGLQSKIWH